MKATEILMQEHRAIERALDILDRAASTIEAGGTVRRALLDDTIRFIRLFADRCHHGKEEGYLFPALERSGLPRHSGPIAVMLHEHDEGRGFVGTMNESLGPMEAGDGGAGVAFCRAARGFTELLRGHIMKEDQVLFVMADMRLPDDEKDRLSADFASVEASGEACRMKADLLRTLERLERETAAGINAAGH